MAVTRDAWRSRGTRDPTYMVIAKIVSGGQTGVDRGALEAAVELGFPYGGLVPKGRRAEDGVVPEAFDQMTEAPFESYVYRTEQNVVNSDCTLIISREIEKFKPPEKRLSVRSEGVGRFGRVVRLHEQRL